MAFIRNVTVGTLYYKKVAYSDDFLVAFYMPYTTKRTLYYKFQVLQMTIVVFVNATIGPRSSWAYCDVYERHECHYRSFKKTKKQKKN